MEFESCLSGSVCDAKHHEGVSLWASTSLLLSCQPYVILQLWLAILNLDKDNEFYLCGNLVDHAMHVTLRVDCLMIPCFIQTQTH